MELDQLKQQFKAELNDNILKYWVDEVYDAGRKTFFGKITNDNQKFAEAPLSAVFMTRVMWTFSAACRVFPDDSYKKMADEAFRILLELFWDRENGGIYWSVFPDGKTEESKKQFYAEAFFIYALSEYYLAFHDEKAKQLAISMFMLIEGYAFDVNHGGYIEAATADWKEIGDQRLSPKDLDVKKSMNTHLHILEAYTNLYRIHKDEQVRQKLEHLVRVFLDRIVDRDTGHLILFFDADWKVRSAIKSYGHDIEATWLLHEAAEVLGNQEIAEEVERVALAIADVTLKEGIEHHGGLFYEKEGDKLTDEFHWWPQSEAVIGFYNAWQISGQEKYLEASAGCWRFIREHLIDKQNGEWFWGVDSELAPLAEEKINPWKAPYHNSRMCLEMIRRIGDES